MLFRIEEVVRFQHDPEVDETLQLVRLLRRMMIAMSDNLTTEIAKLQADVAAQGTVIDSAATLINGFSAQLSAAVAAAQAAGATPDQLSALTALDTSIAQKTSELSAAVASQTPAAPVAPAAPADPATPAAS